jgi:hypothetical protein
MKKLIVLIVFISTLLSAQTQEQIQKEIGRYSDNIGFVQSSQKEKLKEQFTMCDEFLDIHWFEKTPNKLQRGWRKYTYFDYKYDEQLKKYVETKKKITVYELVEIQEDGHAEYYGIYFIKRAFQKTWKQVIQDMTISGNNKQFTFHYKGKKYDASKFKFNMADNYLNICIAKPDNQTALFYEMKRANKVLSDEEQDVLVKKINDDGIKLVREALDGFVSMDINYDGIIDLFFQYFPSVVYSYKEKYQKTERKDIWIDKKNFFVYTFPQSNQTCKYDFYGLDGFFGSNGKNLYFKKNDVICNLTQLTTQGEN